VFQDEALKELQARNEARVKQMIEQMGTKYLCHPANFITKAKFKKDLRKSKKKAMSMSKDKNLSFVVQNTPEGQI